MSKQTIVIDAPLLSAGTFQDNYQLKMGSQQALNGVGGYLKSVAGGLQTGSVVVRSGSVQADGYLRVATGGSVAAQACTICNITLTGRASGPVANEFVVSATAATQAANMVAAINASASFVGKVVASLVNADVVLTAVIPGAAGNGLQLSAGNLANVTLPKAFAGGSDGTKYTL